MEFGKILQFPFRNNEILHQGQCDLGLHCQWIYPHNKFDFLLYEKELQRSLTYYHLATVKIPTFSHVWIYLNL